MVRLYLTVPSDIPGRIKYPLPIYLDNITASIRKAEGRIVDFPYDLYSSAEEYLSAIESKLR